MQYFRLQDDMSMKMRNRWHIGRIYLPDNSEIWIPDGERFDKKAALHANVHHVGYVLDFCHTTFGVPIGTLELSNTIAEVADGDIQCIPITISGQTARTILHALRIVRCVHESESKFQKFLENDSVRPDLAGQYRYISRLVLDKAAIPPDAHFFRVKDWTVCLIVSEAVKDAMERVGCYGAEFTELEMA